MKRQSGISYFFKFCFNHIFFLASLPKTPVGAYSMQGPTKNKNKFFCYDFQSKNMQACEYANNKLTAKIKALR